jgi:hypothetical protein
MYPEKPKRGESPPIDASKAIRAEIILHDPTLLDVIDRRYILVYAVGTQFPLLFQDLLQVLEIADDFGWDSVGMAPLGETGVYVLLKYVGVTTPGDS